MKIVITHQRNEWRGDEEINAFSNLDDLKGYLRELAANAERDFNEDLTNEEVELDADDIDKMPERFAQCFKEIDESKFEDFTETCVLVIPYGDDVIFYDRTV